MKNKKVLHLNLKKKWFDMILSGEKVEEYREIKEHWFNQFFEKESRVFNRLVARFDFDLYQKCVEDNNVEIINKEAWGKMNENFQRVVRNFDLIIFSNGYAKNRPQFEAEFKGIEIGTGKEKWGAEKGKRYFVVKVGRILSIDNVIIDGSACDQRRKTICQTK